MINPTLPETGKEECITIDDHQYALIPNNYIVSENFFEKHCGFQYIHEQAKKAYVRQNIDTPLQDEHRHILREHLNTGLCQSLIEEFEQNPRGIEHESVAKVLLPEVFNESLDEQIRSYFESEYCIFWWSVYKVDAEDEDTSVSAKWHCDGGPKNHLKVIIYLNGFDEHESDTPFLDKATSDELKKIGYIFNMVTERASNIEPLCQHFNIHHQPQSLKPGIGDAVIFNPNLVAHKALPPKPEKTRYVLNFCLLPSNKHWQEIAESYYFPQYGCQDFKTYPSIAEKFSPKRSIDESCIEIGLNYQIKNMQHVEYLLANMFNDLSVSSALFEHIKSTDPELSQCQTVFSLLTFIKSCILAQFNANNLINSAWAEALTELATYESKILDTASRYRVDNKPNPEGVFWPDPTHERYPRNKLDTMPYACKQPIMDLSTPIGSAGSCFAFEIAKHFQLEGYNYVVTERNEDPNAGVLVDGYNPGDKIAKFSANFGILFNTPSFTQLAEKAFGIRQFSKLLFEDKSGFFIDPYRENVLFSCRESYLADYEKHIAAIRKAFLQCKVFVVTLGLNECWQLQDGTFMSRNPRENMHHLVKHRTLTVQENVDNIQRFFDIIKQHNPDFKLVISVSPIPLLATGRANEHHIISANCHSKSVLRVAAEELVANNQDMYYLPSYELVTECSRDAWEDDSRHVKPETVARVVSMFKEMFVNQST